MNSTFQSALLSSAFKQSLACILLWVSACASVMAQDDQLPFVTGTSYDGEQITWDALSEAAGYNIFFEFQYIDTVIGTSFIPEAVGEYRISAFDRMGRFSPLQLIVAGAVPTFNIAMVDTLPGALDTGSDDDAGSSAVDPDQLPTVSGVVSNGSTITWDPVDGASGYNIYLDNVYLDTVENSTSYQTTGSGRFSVAAFDNLGRFSPLFEVDESGAQLEFTNFVVINDTAPDPTDIPDPTAPQNLRVEVYGPRVAELFWDRPSSSEQIVETEVFRDGALIGTTPGISFFDDTRAFGARHEYQLVAINVAGERSDSTFTNASPFIGPAEEVAQTLLTGLSAVINNNPHVRYFPLFQEFAENGLSGDLSLVSEDVFEDPATGVFFVEEYECDFENGIAIITRTDVGFGRVELSFTDCNIDGSIYEGQVVIANRESGGYLVDYSIFLLTNSDVEMDGAVELTIDPDTGTTTLTYTDFSFFELTFDDSSFDGADDVEVLAELNQVIRSSLSETPAFSYATELTVIGPFTNDRTFEVTTLVPFTGADEGSGNYLQGELVAVQLDENAREDSLVLNADTGVATTWQATLTQDGEATTITDEWNDSLRLPCIAAPGNEAATPGCLSF